MLAGRPPFEGPTAQAVLARRLTEQPPSVRDARPEVPVEVEALIARAMAPAPSSRFATAADLVAALRRGQLAAPATPLERFAARTARLVRRKTVVAASSLVALVAAASCDDRAHAVGCRTLGGGDRRASTESGHARTPRSRGWAASWRSRSARTSKVWMASVRRTR